VEYALNSNVAVVAGLLFAGFFRIFVSGFGGFLGGPNFLRAQDISVGQNQSEVALMFMVHVLSLFKCFM
jgi:hypothetical protein